MYSKIEGCRTIRCMYGRINTVFRCNPGRWFTAVFFIEIRPVYNRYTVSIRQKIRQEYGRKPSAWITATYGGKRPFTCKIRERNGRLRLNYVYLRSTVITHLIQIQTVRKLYSSLKYDVTTYHYETM